MVPKHDRAVIASASLLRCKCFWGAVRMHEGSGQMVARDCDCCGHARLVSQGLGLASRVSALLLRSRLRGRRGARLRGCS